MKNKIATGFTNADVKLNNVPRRFIKTAKYEYIHLFTNGLDVYFDVINNDLEPARKLMNAKIKEWKKQGITEIRAYYCLELEDYRDGQIDTETERCIYSLGKYPH